MTVLCAFMLFLAAPSSPNDPRAHLRMSDGFIDPPLSARPHTWWHWMNGNVTREGITADLEAMKRIGLGGAQIFNVSEGIPEGPVRFMSDEWRALVGHAIAEADRLGLELCMHNCAGWSSSGGPWITPEFAMQMVVASEKRVEGPTRFSETLPRPETRLGYYRDIAVLAFQTPADDAFRIADISVKAGYGWRYAQLPDLKETPPDAAIRRDAILDLTSCLDAQGRLEWDVPAGKWTILRVGHTPTGKDNHPSPESGRGLECDKLSREAFDVHWDNLIAKVISDAGPLAGRTLRNMLIDSYEVGPQNWTPKFREEFQKRRGYDPLKFLPVMTGRVVDDGPTSERFLWDLRRTIADLFFENYYNYFAQRCHAAGLIASIEPYDGPFECLQVARSADIPMGEFWTNGGASESCRLAASAGHIYGRTIIGAEAFTAFPQVGRWQNHPANLKAIGDLMYCSGINRFIIHRYAHQPWLDRFPGMTMGQWGTHFERTLTWWDQGAAWISYLSRCQFVLQQGRFLADVLFFAGDSAPNGAPFHPELKALGFDYDACSADVIRERMTVRDGRIALSFPSQMSYRLLVLPDTPFMLPETLMSLSRLIHDGATVLGPRPRFSPSLAGGPDVDAQLARLAEAVWGPCDGTTVKENRFGQGRVLWGMSPAEALAAMGVAPDCEFRGQAGLGPRPRIAWIHRQIDDMDVYFVSNQQPWAVQVQGSFRVTGKTPDLWNPEKGIMMPAPVWSSADGRTTVALNLEPSGSVFVVFRKPDRGIRHLVHVATPASRPPLPRIEIHEAIYEAIDGAGGADVTGKVRELVEAGEFVIEASNATFGDPTYMHVKRLRVDYSIHDERKTVTVEENGRLILAPFPDARALPDFEWTWPGGGLELVALRSGTYVFTHSDGKTVQHNVSALPAPIEPAAAWTVRFQPGRGAPETITLDRLISWTDHADPGIRYFSGTAIYENTFNLEMDILTPDRSFYLDLGDVQCLAEVTLNDTYLGVWWKPPYAADASSAIHRGRNTLKVAVTNLWVNRLIGDEQFPDDCEWNGPLLKRWPKWLVEGLPRPVPQRLTFTTFRHFTKDSPLLPSGLIGPVRLVPAVRVGTN